MSADAIVKSFIDRILCLKEEQDTIAADTCHSCTRAMAESEAA